jgi:hypothetical protein
VIDMGTAIAKMNTNWRCYKLICSSIARCTKDIAAQQKGIGHSKDARDILRFAAN